MSAHLHILVADGDRDFAECLGEVLTMNGHQAQLTFNADETARALQDGEFDVVLANVKMRGLTAVDSFVELRRIKPATKSILMTGHSVDQLATQAADGAPVKVLHKPAKLEVVLAAVDESLPNGMVLVDDESGEFGQALADALGARGSNVCLAKDRAEAMQRAIGGGLDLLILDLEQSVIVSLEIYLELKSLGAEVPIVMISSLTREAGGAMNAVSGRSEAGIIFKPFDPSELIDAFSRTEHPTQPEDATTPAENATNPEGAVGLTGPPGDPLGTAIEAAKALGATVLGTNWPNGPQDAFAAAQDTTHDEDPVSVFAEEPVADSGATTTPAVAPPEEDVVWLGKPHETIDSPPVQAPDTAPAAGSQSAQSVDDAAPTVPAQGPGSGRVAAAPGISHKGHILVIDDDRDMADGLAEILEESGYEVQVAHVPERALKIIQEFKAQVALVDIQLGRKSGLDLIDQLKEQRPDLLCVMVTARTDQEAAVAALRKGAFDYLNKPLNPEELQATLDRAFAKSQRPRDPENSDTSDAKEPDSDFLADLSHRLRTPLNAMVGFSEIMSEQMLGPLGSKQYLDYAKDISEAGKHLIDMLDDFVAVDKTAAGKLELNEHNFDLSRVIFHCFRMLKETIESKDLHVEVSVSEIPLFLKGDEHKLTQVILGLLTNAVKFTPENGQIHLKVYRDIDGHLQIEVQDTGVGMATEAIPMALSTAVAEDGSLAPDYEGTGLSLPLASYMVELHDGKLSLASQLGHGTRATIVLPGDRIVNAVKRAAG